MLAIVGLAARCASLDVIAAEAAAWPYLVWRLCDIADAHAVQMQSLLALLLAVAHTLHAQQYTQMSIRAGVLYPHAHRARCQPLLAAEG